MKILQRVSHANRGGLLLWRHGPVPFWHAYVLMLRNILQSLENLLCVMFRTSSFEYPLVLLLYLYSVFKHCIIHVFWYRLWMLFINLFFWFSNKDTDHFSTSREYFMWYQNDPNYNRFHKTWYSWISVYTATIRKRIQWQVKCVL